MKKLNLRLSVLPVVLISMLLTAYAEPVTTQKAMNVANGKLISLGKSSSVMIVQDGIEVIDPSQNVLCFLFRFEPKGYMVVTADDNLPPVLAYDFTSDFPFENGAENPVLQLIKEDIHLRLANVSKLPDAVIQNRKEEWSRLMQSPESIKPDFLFQQWPPEGTTSTGGWIETNWTQSPPYNNFCPMDPLTNQRSIAGCPATAMAQIVNYYQTINSTVFSDNDDYHHNYSGRNYWIDDDFIAIDFPSFPDLNAWLDTVTMSFESGSSLKNNEKAALTFACGVAAHQVYTSQGSGTFGVNQAEEAYLRFGFTEALLLDGTDTSLYTHLAQNIMDARPAHLAVVNPGWTSGHNVVADGYNTDQYFHLNFGWGGGYNGWYLLPDEIPYGLTVIEGLIVNIAYAPINTGVTYTSSESGLSLELYPNPAMNVLTISYSVCKSSNVKIEIYNMNGILIQIIADSQMDKGSYSANFDIQKSKSRFASGLYLCKLQIDDQVITQQFVIR